MQPALERWLLPLSNAGLLVVALAGVLTGKQFVLDLADAGPSADETRKRDLRPASPRQLQWIWVAAFGAMTVSSVIPPIAFRRRHDV